MYSEIWQHDGQTSGDPIVTYTDLHLQEHNEVRDALTALLADLFALYVKTKAFHWHAFGSSWPTATACRTGGPGLGDDRHDRRARESARWYPHPIDRRD
jgi:hypothetical protein